MLNLWKSFLYLSLGRLCHSFYLSDPLSLQIIPYTHGRWIVSDSDTFKFRSLVLSFIYILLSLFLCLGFHIIFWILFFVNILGFAPISIQLYSMDINRCVEAASPNTTYDQFRETTITKTKRQKRSVAKPTKWKLQIISRHWKIMPKVLLLIAHFIPCEWNHIVLFLLAFKLMRKNCLRVASTNFFSKFGIHTTHHIPNKKRVALFILFYFWFKVFFSSFCLLFIFIYSFFCTFRL